MSFLNPVSLPVKRFSSTDADAPQINYNARTAGDVKAVLKACLVDGYGTTASAGWSIVNEVDNVCEFVSPSAAMSDYRFGIDDGSASSTIWNYHYQNTSKSINKNNVSKPMGFIDKSNAQNGWQMLVTDRGFAFIEFAYYPLVSDITARVTYFTTAKSARVDSDGDKMMFMSAGHSAPLYRVYQLFDSRNPYCALEPTGQNVQLLGATINVKGNLNAMGATVSLATGLYIASNDSRTFLGAMPGILYVTPGSESDVYGIKDVDRDGVSYTQIPLGVESSSTTDAYRYAAVLLIRTDVWGY
ncbi:hypothetical protein ACPESL_07890 [Psychrobacter pocilloporae]|uniref:hypothetical protein n=1 Tax=Psychrobacter pocilloporae TaxID=1775882 RepID=UPI003C2FC1DC